MAHLDHTFGIEIECYLPEGATPQDAAAAVAARGVACVAESYNHLTQSHWKIVTDGSLGDYTRGIEAVSPILQGEAGFDSMQRVMDALEDFGCTVSRRCGLHVHVGVGQANTAFFRNILQTYAFFEPIIDSFMPPSRRANHNSYCRSLYDMRNRIENAVSLDGLLGGGAAERYRKLNLASYRRYSTVEFRQHSGTLDARKARHWTLLCLRLVDAIKQGRLPFAAGTAPTPMINRGRLGTKMRLVGDLMLRPEGVTTQEALAASGWQAVSFPQVAERCGLTYSVQRVNGQNRYVAINGASAASTIPAGHASLDQLLNFCACNTEEADYFRQRTHSMSGAVAWAA